MSLPSLESEETFLKTMEMTLGWTPLHCMVERENIKAVKELIQKGADIKAPDCYNRTALSIAAARGNLQIIELLLDAGGDISSADALHFACENGNSAAIAGLIRQGADLNLKKDDISPLIVAAAKGHLEASKLLIENGADLLAADKEQETALHWACETGDNELISYLIDAGCDVNAKNKYELTPLLICLIRMSDRTDLVTFLLSKGASVGLCDNMDYSVLHSSENSESTLELIKAGADVNAQNMYKETPLFIAAMNHQLDNGKVLLQQGADPNLLSDGGWCSLHYAAAGGWLDYVKELIKCGADVNSRNSQNIIPLHFAAYEGHLEIVKELLENGSFVDIPVISIYDVNAASLYSYFFDRPLKDGATPLALAAEKNHIEVCKLLVSYGANYENMDVPKEVTEVEVVSARIDDWPCDEIITAVRANNLEKVINAPKNDVVDAIGWTLLHHSVSAGLYEMSKELIRLGLPVNVLDKYERTPLSISAARNDLKILKLLLDNGADVDLGLPLHYTVNKSSTDCMQELIDRKCDINIKNKKVIFTNTALIEAAYAEKFGLIKLLLENNADPNCVNEFKENALHPLCKVGDIESVCALLKHGVDVNAADKWCTRPLLCSTPDIMTILLENNANVHVKDDQGWTPLHQAVSGDSEQNIVKLINAGICVNAQCDEGDTSLFLTENINTLKVLIENGADVNICSLKGWTALHEKAYDGQVDCVRELIKHGANVNRGSLENILPIYLASVKGHIEVVEELLSQGSLKEPLILDLHITAIRDSSLYRRTHVKIGNTPLIGAASRGHLEVIKVLRRNGASLEAINCEGNTAVHEAILNKFEEVARYLIEQNVDLKVKNKQGKTALDLAKAVGSEEIVNLILSK